jgi:hypothetical protein
VLTRYLEKHVSTVFTVRLAYAPCDAWGHGSHILSPQEDGMLLCRCGMKFKLMQVVQTEKEESHADQAPA